MLWPQTGATHYHVQLGVTGKGRAIKGFIVCYIVWLGSLKWMGLGTSARWFPCCGQDGYRAQVPNNTPYILQSSKTTRKIKRYHVL